MIRRFAVPALVGMIANALYNIVDRIFVGQIVGPQGIAAIAISFPCMLFFISVSFLIGVGGASRVSILMGEGRRKRAEQTLGNSLLLSLAVSLAMMLAARFLFERILFLSGASETLFPEAAAYLSVIIYGIIFGTVSFSMSYQIRACGSPLYASCTQVIGAISNVLLDAIFVIALDMGVRGAAIATVMSQFISMCWVLAYFKLPKAALKLRLPFVLRPDVKTITRIFAVGTPACLVNLNFVMVHGMITNASSTYGGDLAVSATGIFMSMDSLLFMPAVAISEACQPIVGYNYGAGRGDRVIATIKAGLVATTIFYAVSFAALIRYAEYMVMLFNSTDQHLIEIAARAIRFANLGIPVMSVTLLTTALLQGLGRGREGLMLAVIRFGLFLWVPLLTLPRFFGLIGAWISFPVSDICGSIVSGIFMFRTIMKLKRGEDLGLCPNPPGN
ncbi:MAG: MATE family efflux transporter [Synergistaceae bacterium]|nr:MATE family efflux transporter [Synergistaceae bacterium]